MQTKVSGSFELEQEVADMPREVLRMADEVQEIPGPGGLDQEQLQQAFQLFMQKAAELEGTHATLQAKVDELTNELAKKVREVEALRDHLSNVLESVADAVIALDVKGRVTSFNSAAEELLGRPEQKCLGRTLEEVGGMSVALGQFASELPVSGSRRKSEEMVLTRDDGSEVVLLVSVAPLRDARGSLSGAVASAQDITQLRELERALARKERLAALGEMAAVLAHEIRNPLGGIQLYAGILGRSESISEEERRVVGKLTKGVSGLNKLVEDMLAFAREIVASRVSQDVRMPLEGAIDQASLELEAKNIILEKKGWERPLVAAVDGDLLSRAILNLLLNSAEAVGAGGRIEISAGFEISGDRRILAIRISDNGNGLSDEELKQVFNPFYTTKAKGTGLGLAIVSRIVAAHGGEISAENNENGGASFALKLPVEV